MTSPDPRGENQPPTSDYGEQALALLRRIDLDDEEVRWTLGTLLHDDLVAFMALTGGRNEVCPSCGFTGRQANVWQGGVLVESCRDPWHANPELHEAADDSGSSPGGER